MKKVFAFSFLIAATACDTSLAMKEQQFALPELSVEAKDYINDRVTMGSLNDPACIRELKSLFDGISPKVKKDLVTSAIHETFKVVVYIFEGNANYAVQHVLNRIPLSRSGGLFWEFLKRDYRTLRFIGKIAGTEAPLTMQNYFLPLLEKYDDPRMPLEQVGLYILNDDQENILIGMFAAVLSNIYSCGVSFQGAACRSIEEFRFQYPALPDVCDVFDPHTDFNHLKVKLLYEGKMMSVSAAKRKFFERLTGMFDEPTEDAPDNDLRYFVRQLFGI